MRKKLISDVMAEMGRRRGKKLSPERRQKMLQEIGAKGGRASWAGMTAAQRRIEMRRRLRKKK
jgi:general stress protein YciG